MFPSKDEDTLFFTGKVLNHRLELNFEKNKFTLQGNILVMLRRLPLRLFFQVGCEFSRLDGRRH